MKTIDIIRSQPIRHFSKKEVLFSYGTSSDTFLIIREGIVMATTTEESGRRRILWVAGRYDIVPLERFFTKKQLQYDYICYTEGSAYVMKKNHFHEIIKENPAVALEIAQGMSEHFDDLSERLSAIGETDINRKLLHTLYTLSSKFNSADVVNLHDIGMNLSHQDLADLIGASREVVSLELKKIRSEGYIEYSRASFTVYRAKIRRAMQIVA